jgi:hypothetical protein
MKEIVHVFLGTCFFLGVILNPLHSASTIASVSFDPDELYISGTQDYDHIFLKGCDLTDQVGSPQLPVYVYHLSLPPGVAIKDVKLINSMDELLSGTYTPFPAQPPAILGMHGKTVPIPRFVEPVEEVYGSDAFFPEKIIEVAASGHFGDSSIGAVLVYPVSFRPDEKKLIFHRSVEFQVEYEVSTPRSLQQPESPHAGSNLIHGMLSSLTGESYASQVVDGYKGSMQQVSQDEYPYVIITSNNLRQTFTPLIEWKTKKGVKGIIISTEYIDQTYSGTDLAEKIRNFIIEAYQNSGTQWILLGGDTKQ